MESEFWKQTFGSLARKLITFLAGMLVAYGVLSEDQVSSLFTETFISAIVGFLLIVGGIVWSHMKIKYNLNFVKAGIKADPGTPLEAVKADALSREQTQISV